MGRQKCVILSRGLVLEADNQQDSSAAKPLKTEGAPQDAIQAKQRSEAEENSNGPKAGAVWEKMLGPTFASGTEAAQPQSSAPAPKKRRAPAIVLAPPDERRENQQWRQTLNQGLKRVLQAVERNMGKSRYPFLQQVDIEDIPDYHHYVKEEDEMWLQHIAQKTRLGAFSCIDEFRVDTRRLLTNCKAYNSPGCGKFGSPELIGRAENLVKAVDEALAVHGEALKTAEEHLKDPGCPPPDQDQTLTQSKLLRASPILVPLPAGFTHSRKVTSGKPEGYTQYWAECINPDCSLKGHIKADRASKLAALFNHHKNCREEWKEFGQQNGETNLQHEMRLKQTFNFLREPPPATPHFVDRSHGPSTFLGQSVSTAKPAIEEGKLFVSNTAVSSEATVSEEPQLSNAAAAQRGDDGQQNRPHLQSAITVTLLNKKPPIPKEAGEYLKHFQHEDEGNKRLHSVPSESNSAQLRASSAEEAQSLDKGAAPELTNKPLAQASEGQPKLANSKQERPSSAGELVDDPRGENFLLKALAISRPEGLPQPAGPHEQRNTSGGAMSIRPISVRGKAPALAASPEPADLGQVKLEASGRQVSYQPSTSPARRNDTQAGLLSGSVPPENPAEGLAQEVRGQTSIQTAISPRANGSAETEAESRVCTACGVEKHFSEFYKEPRKSRRKVCKECTSKKKRERRAQIRSEREAEIQAAAEVAGKEAPNPVLLAEGQAAGVPKDDQMPELSRVEVLPQTVEQGREKRRREKAPSEAANPQPLSNKGKQEDASPTAKIARLDAPADAGFKHEGKQGKPQADIASPDQQNLRQDTDTNAPAEQLHMQSDHVPPQRSKKDGLHPAGPTLQKMKSASVESLNREELVSRVKLLEGKLREAEEEAAYQLREANFLRSKYELEVQYTQHTRMQYEAASAENRKLRASLQID